MIKQKREILSVSQLDEQYAKHHKMSRANREVESYTLHGVEVYLLLKAGYPGLVQFCLLDRK